MSRREKMIAVLPTLLTLGNAACGFASITFAAKVGPEPTEGTDPLFLAAIFIYAAMIFDALDGHAARLTNQTSEFGAELDSLCDAISCGVAPAFLMLQFCGDFHPRILWVIGALYAVCAVLRLARFNVETDEDDSHEHFSGLPSPAAAGTVASIPIAMHGLQKLTTLDTQIGSLASAIIPFLTIALPVMTLCVAFLMVSRIRYPHAANQLFRGRKSRAHLIQLVFTVALIFTVRELAVPLLFCFFAFTAPIQAGIREAFSRLRLHKQPSN